ncbi:hypothetical protein L596_003087 [Steinernema carpocapsae]|uniref:ShKT domain-containing protein n=1 Tax=Steinernema carpocapsae TaxID=34508 RepID=A0A4U8URD7_STECR|nr:hypothetical protein L596_003084 [Steinernema carpocapsae]TMS35762.1 hypothetical protein L596_003087 [Steinernema carpocapsae]
MPAFKFQFSDALTYFPVFPRAGLIVERAHGVALSTISGGPGPALEGDQPSGRQFISAEGGALVQNVRSENLKSANETTDSSIEAPSAPTSEPIVEGDAQESPTESVETTTVSNPPPTPEALPDTPKPSLYGGPKRIDGTSIISKGYVSQIVDSEAVMETPPTTKEVPTVNVDVEPESTTTAMPVESGEGAAKSTSPSQEGCTQTTSAPTPSTACNGKTAKPLTAKEKPKSSTSGKKEAVTETSCKRCVQDYLAGKENTIEPVQTTVATAANPTNAELGVGYDSGVPVLVQNETVPEEFSLERDDVAGLAGRRVKVAGIEEYSEDEDYAEEETKNTDSLIDAISARFESLFHTVKSQLIKRKRNLTESGFHNVTEVSPSRKSHEAILQKILEKPINIPDRADWHKYEMDCTREEDGFGKRCEDWSDAGLCSTNAATRFLWCRRTCLCVGPRALAQRF